jgi:hypothetical protein
MSQKLMSATVAALTWAAMSASAQQATPTEPTATPPQVAPAPSATPALPSWADKLTFKGDVRYRYESITDDAKGDYTRERNRIRARLGAEAKASDTLKGGIRVSTGGNDPVSPNQTVGDGFQKKDMKLDLAYFDWQLYSMEPSTVSLVAGKQSNCFGLILDRTVQDLLWDPDLSIEGLTLQGQSTLGIATLKANGGYLWVQERDKENDDSVIYAGQAALKLQFIPELYVTAGVGYYDYNRMEGYGPNDWEGKGNFYGNSSVDKVSNGTTNKVYKYDFTPLECFAEVGGFVGRFPVTLYAQTVSNSKADDNDKGYLYGLTLGKAKNPKTFEVGVQYAELEKNAVAGFSTDSDRWGGGTDGKGWKYIARYQINKNLHSNLIYFQDTKKISDPAKETDYSRMQVDLVFAF